jgi:hypothetical protein
MSGHNNVHPSDENSHYFSHGNSWKDVSGELEQLILLGRLSQYREAHFCFQVNLRDHLDQFSVVAEYADLLLEQSSYGQLSRYCRNRLTMANFGLDENQLLDLSIRLSDIYLHGSQREAVAAARIFWKSTEHKFSAEPKDLSSTLVSTQRPIPSRLGDTDSP